MGPFDYIRDVQNPVQSMMEGMAFGQSMDEGRQSLLASQQQIDASKQAMATDLDRLALEGRRVDQQDVALAQGQQRLDMAADAQRQERLAAAEARNRAQLMQLDMAALAENPNATAQDYAGMIARYPEIADTLGATWELLSEERQKADLLEYSQIYSAIDSGNIEVATDLLKDRATGLRSAGQIEDADMADGMLSMLEMEPNVAKTMLGVSIKALGGNDYDAILGGGPSDTTRATEILPDGTIIRATDAGPVVTDSAGNLVEGEAAAEAIRKAQQFGADLQGDRSRARTTGVNEANIDTGGTAAATVKAAEQAVTMAGEAYQSYTALRGSVSTINSAIEAIDDGARAGVIDRFLPNVTEASARLGTAMNEMGLDVISAVTFGALSEKELALAMETAVPRGLDEKELRVWLEGKREAQEKSAEMILDAAQFLSKPGNTLNDWIEKNRASATETPPAGDQAGQVTIDSLFADFGD